MVDREKVYKDAHDLIERYESRLAETPDRFDRAKECAIETPDRFDRAKECAILNSVSIIEAFKKAHCARDLQIAYVDHWTAVVSEIMKLKEDKDGRL
jgi:hypothetical protein